MEEGVYDVILTLSDGYESTTYTIEVSIIKNTPPYYKKTMGPLIYRNTGTEVYELPQPYDNEDDSIIVKV